MNPCIISFFMDNIDFKTINYQRSVVDKFNKKKYPHYVMKTNAPHGISIDYFWALNGIPDALEESVEQKVDHDVVIILDIDAIPLHEDALEHYATVASQGKLIGNAQRSNHIENGQHVFAAPSTAAISKESFKKIGAPSAMETNRSDVLEEYTWGAEVNEVPVDIVLPLRYDKAPQRYEWEGDQPPYWSLADGMPVYGMGTTYGTPEMDMFYHNFQIRMPGQQENFWKKCEEVLNGKSK